MKIRLIFGILTFFISMNGSMAKGLQTFKLGILESLSITDSSSSKRYKDYLESSLYYALGKNEAKLNKCGYKMLVTKSYYKVEERLGKAKRPFSFPQATH